MENEPMPTVSPSAADAAALLSVVDQAGAAVADRLITPWWYHPVYALLTGMVVVSAGLPEWWRISALSFGALGLAALLGLYRGLTGLGTVTGSGRVVALWVSVVLLSAVTAAGVILLADRPVVTVIAPLAFLPIAVFAGRRADDALRDSLRRNGGGAR